MFKSKDERNIPHKPTKRSGYLVFIGLCGIILALIGETTLDMIFEGEDFYEAFFFPTPHELAIRALFVSTLIFFILYIAVAWRKRDILEESLNEALKKAQLEKNKSEAILEVIGDAISIQDLDLNVIYQNQAHLDLMGNHFNEKCYFAYQKKEVACEGCHLLLCYEDGLPHRREASAPSKDGTIHVEIISTPLKDREGNVVAGIESVRDITHRKETEQSILNLNEELRQKTLELSSLNNDLKIFSYSLSHDLKTPLTIIYGSAQVLHDTHAHLLDETGSYLLQQIILGGERMDQLLDAMLQMAHHTRQELNIEEIDLSVMAHEILKAQSINDPTRKISYTVTDGVIRFGDSLLIRSVMENLLVNALKYTRDQENPVVEFGYKVEDGQHICFVRDNGAGFDMKKADRLFRPFQRLHSQNEFEGNGVGLATVQQILHRHGGRIWAEGHPGQGATFYFTL